MTVFPIEEGGCGGAGTGSYDAGLITLSSGEARGVEDVARLTVRDDSAKSAAARRLPGFLGSLRGALPRSGRLPMPARLAVSTVRAGLGVIEEGLSPDGVDAVPVEIVFNDGTTVVARMPTELVAMIRRDRDVALNAVARSTGATAPSVDVADDSAEALTSIFRYEKRNGRLRRIAEPGPASKG